MFKYILLVSLLLVSCASQSKQVYKLEPISKKDMGWKFCNPSHDLPGMPKYSYTGNICYWHKECIKKFFRKKCRPILLVCNPSNRKCMDKYEIYNKKIK